MSQRVLCIGSVLWDIIGRSPLKMQQGSDVPGRITRLPGGVVLNIAMTLARFDLQPVLLTVVGRDTDGDALMAACTQMGLDVEHVFRSDTLPTDRYMAIEGSNGVIAAIADAHSLEAAGDKILTPLSTGALAKDGTMAVDGNLTPELLNVIATSADFAFADLRIAPASPGKAERLAPFVSAGRGTLYVNLDEAGTLCHTSFKDAADAASALCKNGAHRALVTNGAGPAAFASNDQIIVAHPPVVNVARLTGAGDTFMAAHIAAELSGASGESALNQALNAAAAYVSGEDP